MKVSIIIPIFNGGAYLESCIEGLRAQTYTDIEIILVNDGSTDQSLAVCRKYAALDSRIQVISKEKSGGAGLGPRNSGIDAAAGELMMFLDADDRVEENMVEKLTEAITSNGCDAAVCGYETFIEGVGDKSREIVRQDSRVLRTQRETRDFFAELFPEGLAGYLWNKIYRASVIRENGLRFPDMKRLQDGVFNVHFFDCAQSCCIIDDVLYHYRVNAQTDMFRKCPKNYYELIRMFSLAYIDAKKAWGDYPDDKIVPFFLNELGTCIENTYSPQWDMRAPERKSYFVQIASDPFFDYAVSYGCKVGRYRTLLIGLVQRRRYALISAAVHTKIFLKTGLKRFFYWMKRRSADGKA